MNRIPVGMFVFAAVVIFFAGCNSTSSPPVPVTLAVTPTSALVFSTQSIQLTAADSVGPTDVSWSVPAGSGATVDSTGNFTAPAVTQNTSITVTTSSLKDPTKTSSTTITVLVSGQVTATTNPQVAMYTLTPPAGLNVFIQFGTDTSYKLKTWTQPGPATGSLSFFVAGMLASTDYHMRAVVQAADGSTANDLDHLFTTSALTANGPAMTVTTSPGMTPQPGIEMLDLITGVAGVARLAAVDLSGNVVWTYSASALGTGRTLEGVHLLPNGHFIICGFPDVVREIDLAGNTIRQETTAQLIASLTKAGITMAVRNFHHDVIQLPSGRWIALFELSKLCSDIPNCPAPATTQILGDALVELIPQSDGTFQLGWVWSTFDHLDITRALMGYPDWTHSNAITYTDDENLLLSIRHQSWIIKIDYANGAGAGDILWRLGYQGDFTLLGSTDSSDWFYAQHDPTFATANSSGKFQLAIMDNGNLRVFPAGVTCGTAGQPPCNYSRAPLMEIDETAKTATIISDYKPGEYSFWGGGAQQLGNGNREGDFNAGSGGIFTDIFEVIPGSAPQTVWHLQTSNANAYRGFRMPSLYPGVQW
jgi:arylsulfate sulfotransferase